MGTIQIDGSTPKLTIGNATAEDATILFDGNAQDFYIALDDSADDLLIGLGSTVGTTPIISIDENKQSTFSGALTVGVDDTGHDVKLFGASAGAYMEWDESADELRIMGASADATTSTGKLLLATSLTDINANDVIGKIDFQAPHEAGGTDAITVAASIQAIAQATFTSSVNATDLIFYTGHSEAAAEKVRFTSQNEIGIAGANYGTDGQVLTSGGAGAAVAWEDAGGGNTGAFYVYDDSLSVASATNTIVSTWTEAFDLNSWFASNKYTPQEAGKYVFFYSARMDNIGATARFFVALKKNGAGLARAGSETNIVAASYPSVNTCFLVDMNGSSDYIELDIYHNLGSNAACFDIYLQGFKLA